MNRAPLSACGSALCALALLSASPAWAQELSARPTLYVGGQDLDGNYASRIHLGLTGRSAEVWSGLSAEAEISLLVSGRLINLADNASFLRLRWRPEPWEPGEGFSLTVLPLHADRIYLGFEPSVATQLGLAEWDSRLVPGAELRLVRETWNVFVAMKSQSHVGVVNLPGGSTNADTRTCTVLAGGGAELFSALEADLAAAYSDHGNSLPTIGLAARVAYHLGPVVGAPVDYAHSQSDPALWEKIAQAESYPGGLSTTFTGDLVYLSQGKQTGVAAQVEARLRWNELRAFLRGQVRDPGFLLSRNPGIFFADDARGSEVELFAALDYHLPWASLTPGIGGSVRLPATMERAYSPGAVRTVVIYPGTDLGLLILPDSEGRQPVALVKATLRWDTARFSAIGEAIYSYDWTLALFARFASPEVRFKPAEQLRFNVLLQARF